MSTYNSLGLSWNPSTTKRMEKLLISIWLEFGMTGVAISFFDTEYEHVQVEHGYDMKSIPREKSIAAHALLSADVLVVEDTQKVCSKSYCPNSFGKLTCNRTGALEAIL